MKKNQNEMQKTSLKMKDGIRVDLLNYGASIQSLYVPTPSGPLNVVLGYADAVNYLTDPYYLGCTLGRYAGRIDSGRFELNGHGYQLEQNDAEFGHSLHSGSKGFSKAYWEQASASDHEVVYRHHSADGEGGFPGNLDCQVTYRLVDAMSFQIVFKATSDSDTVLNLSNHSYFNLSGGNDDIEDHEVWINAERFLPMTPNMVPSGDIHSVEGTEFDFRNPKTVAEGIRVGKEQVELAGGIDHFFLLNPSNDGIVRVASVKAPRSGIRMDLSTSQPGVQFYAGNHLGKPFINRAGLCLEFQTAPNAPNEHRFPSAVLRAGETYRQHITFSFEQEG